jgi:GGDEF domain-containing protein
LAGKVDSLAEVLQLELPPGNDYRAILAHAHERLSAVAGDAAEELLTGKAAAGKLEPDESLLLELRKVADELAADQAAIEARARRRSAAIEAEKRHAAASFTKAAAQLEASHTAHTSSAADGLSSRGVPVTSDNARSKPRGEPPAPQARPQRATNRDNAPHDPGLVGRVAAAVATCRQARRSLSLLVVELDQYEDLLMTCGRQSAEQFVAQLGEQCRRIDHRGAVVVQPRDLQYAVILPDCDRRQAIDLSNELVAKIRDAASSSASNIAATAVATVSIGVASVALPPKNFPAAELIRGAERCLDGARLSGGNAVKSIEIY